MVSTDKNIIFCLSPGRAGTNLLTNLLSLARDTCALHEPSPTFRKYVETVRECAEETEKFVANVKIPDILVRTNSNYVETSHLFGKGPFEAFIKLGLPFRMMILNRNPRDVARSHWRINDIPYRTKKKQMYLLSPDKSGVVPPKGWRKMSDYQLCFWYCLEVERRKPIYSRICKENGRPVVETSLRDCLSYSKFRLVTDALGLQLPEDAEAKHAEMTAEKVNRKAKYLPKLMLRSLDDQEREVWEALGEEGKALEAQVAERYGRTTETARM